MKKVLFSVMVVSMAALTAACDSSPAAPGGATGAPALSSPLNGAQLDNLRPSLTVSVEGTGSGRVVEFQIADRSDFNGQSTGPLLTALTGTAAESGGTATLTAHRDMQPATRFYWRARVKAGDAVSDWSETRTFLTQITGYNVAGELYDPLINGTIGTRVGSTTLTAQGIRVNDTNSYVRYALPATIGAGEFSVEVTGLAPNGPGGKLRVLSMMDGTGNLFTSRWLLNAQYRGVPGNPDNAISFKALFGGEFAKLEPDFSERAEGIRMLNPATVYHWKATWNDEFRLVVEQGGIGGSVIYNMAKDGDGARYAPPNHHAYLGANNGPFGEEDGSWPGLTYRNLWVSSRARPASLGSALR